MFSNYESNLVNGCFMMFVCCYFLVSDEYNGDKLIVVKSGKCFVILMFFMIIVIGFIDLVFVVDLIFVIYGLID